VRVGELFEALAGTPPGMLRSSLVALSTRDGVETLEWVLALIELGLPFLPLHSRLTPREREELLERLPVAWSIDPSGGVQRRQLGDGFAGARQLLASTPHLAALATSGTSGAPRVALLSRLAFLAAAAASAANLGWHAGDRWLLCLPVAHIGGLSIVTRCLLARRPIVLVPEHAEVGSVERLAHAIVAGEASLLSVVPTQLGGLLRLTPPFEMPRRVRALLTGGAAASPTLLSECADRGWPVLTSYGMTEACSQVATQLPGTVNRGELGSGQPLPGVGVRLAQGVIQVGGPTLFSGYMGEGVDSGLNGEGWFQTRDLGRFDAEGRLHVLGRIDDLIITGGENVAPWEVEAALLACPGVLEACVFGVADEHWGQIVAAALRVVDEDADRVVDAAHVELAGRLAAFKRPRLYACTNAFSRGHTGKPDRREIKAGLLDQLREPRRPSRA
jgi:o-succinylbenzoate---CoA ligase